MSWSKRAKGLEGLLQAIGWDDLPPETQAVLRTLDWTSRTPLELQGILQAMSAIKQTLTDVRPRCCHPNTGEHMCGCPLTTAGAESTEQSGSPNIGAAEAPKTNTQKGAEDDTSPNHPAVAELKKLRRVLELAGTVLPDIDETAYEYSPYAGIGEGRWPESWINGAWRSFGDDSDRERLLSRRRRKIRRPPTDQDAIDQPRRPCWVRDFTHQAWLPAQLLAVLPDTPAYAFVVLANHEDASTGYQYCEIEVDI